MHVSRMMVLGMLAAGLLAGCSNDLQQQADMLTDENRDLRDQLTRRDDEMARLHQQLRDKEGELASARTVQKPLAQATGFENIKGVTASYGAGELTVEVESDVLFASGKSTLQRSARESLDGVVAVLNRSYGGMPIRVEGHTDTDPIRKSGFKSNYHLGFERAWAVRDYLVSKGIEEQRISLASYGPNEPRDNKPASRRVQIVVEME